MKPRDSKGQFVKQYTEEELKERSNQSNKTWQTSDSGVSSSRKAQVSYRAKRRSIIHEMKKNLSCVYCGVSNPLCIDFDHIDRSSKLATPATMITGGYKWKDVLAEIEKCQPVCANCHRMKSILESDKMKAIEEDIFQYVPQKLKDQFLHTYQVTPQVDVDSS